uniref:Uncharacterized protein n=1 Tax=Gossypium raimondii TaxID=29730 RepID=A0A0D2NTG5_GOSRA|nr:hypothetical protein B456_006G158400 [Gossypium raimondii]
MKLPFGVSFFSKSCSFLAKPQDPTNNGGRLQRKRARKKKSKDMVFQWQTIRPRQIRKNKTFFFTVSFSSASPSSASS